MTKKMAANARRTGVPTKNVFNRPERRRRPAFSMTWNQAAVRWRSNTFQTVKRMIEEEKWPKQEGVSVLSIDILCNQFREITRSRAAAVVVALQKTGRTMSRGYNERLGSTLYVVSETGRAYYNAVEAVMRTRPPEEAPEPSGQSKVRRLQERVPEKPRVPLEPPAEMPYREEQPPDDQGTMILMKDWRNLSMPSSLRLREHPLKGNLPWLKKRIEWQRSTHREPDSDAAWNSVSRVLGLRLEDLRKVWNSTLNKAKK